jgi:hypothetical protein
MFRVFSFALAVVLCTSGWSKAQAGLPEHYTLDNGKEVRFDPPLVLDWGPITVKQDKIGLPTWSEIVTFSAFVCSITPKCRKTVGNRVLHYAH